MEILLSHLYAGRKKEPKTFGSKRNIKNLPRRWRGLQKKLRQHCNGTFLHTPSFSLPLIIITFRPEINQKIAVSAKLYMKLRMPEKEKNKGCILPESVL